MMEAAATEPGLCMCPCPGNLEKNKARRESRPGIKEEAAAVMRSQAHSATLGTGEESCVRRWFHSSLLHASVALVLRFTKGCNSPLSAWNRPQGSLEKLGPYHTIFFVRGLPFIS